MFRRVAIVLLGALLLAACAPREPADQGSAQAEEARIVTVYRSPT
jgi:PBP1b-binding outer membrane lipoprotein LpoB